MKNAIIVGFESKSLTMAIEKLVKNNFFNCSLWISNNPQHINNLPLRNLFNFNNISLNKIEYQYEYEIIFKKYFHQFVHSLSREKSVDFSYFEFVNLFTLHFYYFYNFIKDNNIELLVASNFLHEGDYLLYPIAKELFNIEIIIFNQTQFKNRFWYINSIEDYGIFNNLKKLNNNNNSDENIDIDMNINLFYMKKTLKRRIESNCLFKFIFKDLEKIFNKKRAIRLYQQYIKYIKCKIYKNNIEKYVVDKIDLNEKFVYLPLHLQPELTSSIFGGKYADQLLIIENLINIIPKDWKIYVKENPYQTFFQRDSLFFKRLNINKQVFFIKDVSSNILIKYSQFVANISGTAGWEALQMGKPVLLFGRAWYLSLPGVFMFDNNFKFEDINNFEFNQENLKKEFNQLLSNTFYGIVDEDYCTIFPEYDEDKNSDLVYLAIKKILNKVYLHES